MEHELYMRRCFQLACLGAGSVSPNPLVGSVLVYNNKVIAEGFHKKFGGPHAEVEVLRQVTDPAVLRKSTLYVNLEPCSHTGKTPPCTDLIISKKVGKVVISIHDPFPAVNGNGVRILTDAGISVIENILPEEGALLNRRFITFHRAGRPYIILKWAQSIDGFIAPLKMEQPGIHWISNSSSRLLVHFQRSRERAILAGSKTVASDNPRLNVRGISGIDPVRIIIDPQLDLNTGYHVFSSNTRTVIVNAVRTGVQDHLTYLRIQNSENLIPELLDYLYLEKIQSVLIEGGSFTIDQFIKNGIWDEALVFTGNEMLGEGIKAPETGTVAGSGFKIGSDTLSVYIKNQVV